MQLKEIIIHNIASLKGTHKLQFSSEFFNDNLFAITGPTGSGKSTILAAISLGLFGSHYKDKLNTIELITLGEATGRCEVYFQYQGMKYKSVWEGTVLKSNGEPLQKPKIIRTLFRLTENSYEAINEKIEDILKLTFEQFCKTVILNQGEFNRFITSDFKERKEILERLADNNKLVQMNTKLREEINETKNQIENKQNWVAGRQHLSEENVQEITKRILLLTEELKIINVEFSSITQNHKKFQEIMNNLKTRGENLARRASLQEQLNGKIKDLNDCKLKSLGHQKIQEDAQQIFLKEEPQLRKADEALVKKQHLEENLLKANTSRNQKQSLIKQLIGEEILLLENLEQALKKKKTLTDQIHFRIFSPDEKKSLDSEINKLHQLNQDSLLANKELEFTDKDLALKLAAEIELTNDLSHIEKQLDSDKKLSLPTLASLIEIDRETDQHIIKLESVNAGLTSNLKYFPDIGRHFISAASINDNLNRDHKIIEEKSKKLEFYELALSISHCHDESQKTGHCVVCGHNFTATKLTPEIQLAIQGDLKQDKESLTNLKKELILKEEAGAKLIQLLATAENQNIDDFDKLLLNLKNKKLKNQQIIQEARTHENKLVLLIERQKTLLKSQTNFATEASNLKEKTNQLAKKIKSLLEQKKAIITSVESLIKDSFSEDSLSQLLNDIRISTEIDHLTQTGQIQENQLKNLNERKIAEQLLLKRNDEEANNLNTEISLKKQFIQEIVGDSNPRLVLQEKKAYIDQLNLTKNKLQDQLHQAELGVKDFEGRLKMSQEQVDAISIMIMSHFHQFKVEGQKLIQEKYKLWTINPQYLNFLNGILEKLDFTKSIDAIDVDSLTLIFNQATETLAAYSQYLKQTEKEVIEGKANLKTVEDQREQIIQALDLIEQKTKVLNRLKNLYDVIGKDEFRNFILSLIEKQLLILANGELKNLCNDRYELVQGTKRLNQGPEFYVIDKLSGGLRRNISTLSGGETFLISLAMALGLAEMTRGQAEIDSFFIDEGFGTLDQDAIEEVLEVLERMQTRGKQIGVISHIKSLTDRISVNIKLVKNSQGYSSLSIIQN